MPRRHASRSAVVVARVEDEARALGGAFVHVHDRIRKTAGAMDHGGRSVAQRDHLALAARLEPGRHHVQVRARVDAPGKAAIERLDHGHRSWAAAAASARRSRDEL